MPEWLSQLATWVAGLGPIARYAALAIGGVAAGYWLGPKAGGWLLAVLSKVLPSSLQGALDSLRGDPLTEGVRALTSHVDGTKALPAPALPMLRAGVALATGQPVPSDLAAQALDSISGAEAHSELSPDTNAAVLRVGRALANGAAPAPKDVSATRRVLSAVPTPDKPSPMLESAGAPDSGTRVEIRIRRGADLLSDVELRIPESGDAPNG